jgi:dihydrofolate reductase
VFAATVAGVSVSSGRISVRLAMSLDGFIADEQGGYDWIVPVASPNLDTEHQLPFDDFLEDVDVVVMGRRCYDQEQHRDYVALGKRVIVATLTRSLLEKSEEGVDFVGDDVVDVVKTARDGGQHCLLFGGGVLVQSFLAAGAVDMLTIGVVPVVLGRGRPLFPGERPLLELRLTDYTVQDGKIRLVYQRR